jgi:hypothetical protein
MQPPRTIDPSFIQHLTAEDELGMVVRAHIHIEASVIDFVSQRVPHPHLLPRLTYEARLRLACALGLDHEYFDALKSLGDIRNSFGHNLDAKVTDQVINNLFSRLPEFAKTTTVEVRQRIIDGGDSQAAAFDRLSARDRFVLIAVVLKTFVLHAAARAHLDRVDA